MILEKGNFMYRNEEVEDLKKKILLCVVVLIFVVVLGLCLVFNRFSSSVNDVSAAINKKESFVVLFQNKDCDTCSMVEDRLNQLGVTYYTFNTYTSSFDDVLLKLKIDYKVLVPAVYVIDKGQVLYNINNIQDQETIDSFIRNNNISSFSNENS